ncbi:MAG: competence protein CoiA [Clostridioides sp.]|nr:competence protein CoiA [Clostridioides sp.]
MCCKVLVLASTCAGEYVVVLGVNKINHVAHKLYLKCGFVDTGKRIEDLAGRKDILVLSFKL